MGDQHPAPWRWVGVGGVQLVSADHVEWTEDDDGHDDVLLSDRILCIPGEMSPYVREVVRAAPEMAALLREDWDKGGEDCNECSHTPIPTTVIDGQAYRTDTDRDRTASHCGGACFRCRQRALLARIDAAADAGNR